MVVITGTPPGQYRDVWNMPGERLSRGAWVSAGLRALARSGFGALKADILAKSLGVSRGSFYWHFADVAAFHAAVLGRWREVALENIVAELEKTPGDPLKWLIGRAFAEPSKLETAVRAWATADRRVRTAVESVDADRVRYLVKLLAEAGIDPGTARSRARLLNWAYLGRSLSSQQIDAAELQAIVDDVLQLVRSPAP
jgi:AcrR family transcriptional regulator